MYKVLLVDDERWIVESLKKALDWEGYGFRIAGEAYNGVDAYDRIAELQPDLAFVDIRMPGMNGLELIQKVREQDYAIEMVVASGHAEFEYARKAMNTGAAGYCIKPFHRGELAEVVQRIKKRLDKQSEKRAASTRQAQQLGGLPEQQPRQHEAGMQAQQSGQPETGMQVQQPEQLSEQGPFLQEKKGNPQLREILSYLQENYYHNITVQSVSKRFFMHPNYLSQLFKKEMKTNFTQYVTSMRMACAQRLLRESELPVSDIAERTGYRDYFYFARTFKKHTGMTPTAYREAQ
ncbi:response regulator transcription factor [Paenibacillus chungangensis]|uniref:Response regulator n=1 Tax=Paenibacillus chungangensis TaxID=696535 RepID=A0ABW3HSF9_9BACL